MHCWQKFYVSEAECVRSDACLASSAMAELVRNMTARLKSADCGEGFASEDSDPESCGHWQDVLARVFQQINYCMKAESKRQLPCIVSQTVFRQQHVGRLMQAAQDINKSSNLKPCSETESDGGQQTSRGHCLSVSKSTKRIVPGTD